MVSQPSDPLIGLAINPGDPAVVVPGADELGALGVRWIRVLLTHQSQNFDTGQNAELDSIIERYQGLGVKLLALINPESLGLNPPPQQSPDWAGYGARVAAFARKVATHYRGRIAALEVFNEPDNQELNPEDFGGLLAAAYPQIKAANPLLPVIAGGIMWGENHDYLRRVVAASQDAFDFAGWHPYGEAVDGFPASPWGIGDLRTSITRAREIAGKPLWLTEMGAELGYTWPGTPSPESAVAEYLTRVFALLRELGPDVVRRCFWFTWRIPESGWGLVDNAGNRRPAWYALQRETQHTPAVPLITNLALEPTALAAGQLLNVSITVANYSNETLITQGPEPGYQFVEGDTVKVFDVGYPPVVNAFRVGLDFDERSGIDHPYRWGLGTPLAPGETRVITGAIQMKTPRTTHFWAGLVKEWVAWVDEPVGYQAVTIYPAPAVQLPEIIATTFEPTTLDVGQALKVSVTVRNNTGVMLPTQGPDPNFEYAEGESFYDRGSPDVRGAFRVGVDFDGRSGIDHPYRWGLGSPLAPGETRVITGTIRLKTPRVIRYWTGLVQEDIAWLQDQQGTQTIAVNPVQSPQITAVTFSPTTLGADGLLQVKLTVRNPTNAPLPTQGPDPGFTYNEGDTFDTRGFPAVAGNLRVGIDFDGRIGMDHPYRWGFGSPLAPGETRTITGNIRLTNPQSRNFWAGLVEEWVAWRQDRQGVQAISVPGAVRSRVAHIHNPKATTWVGQPDYWNYVNQDAVNAMVERGVMTLTNAASLKDAWQKLLPGYTLGAGIVIKVNVTNDGNGLLDASIQTVNAIVRGLVQRGVQPGDIWVCEPRHSYPARFVDGCLYPGVKFYDVNSPDKVGFTSTDPSALIVSATPPDLPPFPEVRLADAFVQAKYVINLPMLKGHLTGAGVTLGFKLHLGSTSSPSSFHPYIFPAGNYFRADYNPLVDLNANPHIRNKTVLTIGDGLFGGDVWNSPPRAMKTFGNQPPNSLFFSADPVAVDSVMYDYVSAEWQVPAGADNYLRLAAQRGLGVYERGDPSGSGYKLIDYQRIEL